MIDVYARYFGHAGGPVHARNFAQTLDQTLSVALHPLDTPPWPTEVNCRTQTMLSRAGKKSKPTISLGIGAIEIMTNLRHGKKIASTFWETTRLPEDKLSILQQVDEIWIPSSWGRNILIENGISAEQIKVVPEGVNTEYFRPAIRNSNKEQRETFRFLCVGKWEKRKGMDKLIRAWSKAFTPLVDVELILHCHNPYIEGFSLHDTISRLDLKSAPIVISEPVTDITAMVDLYNECDAFVLPSRGEGWGLPIIEAMACGKPVIVTNNSAYLDFVDNSNAYLIDVERMSHVYDPLFFNPLYDYGEWAEPDEDHLVTLLRHIADNRQEAKDKGNKARQDVVRNWTWQHAVNKALGHLDV